MNRIKIAIFGITDDIMLTLGNTIDFRKVEFTAFIDNDSSKHSKEYMGIPVVDLKQVSPNDADIFLITAYSAFNQIEAQLLEYGVEKQRIQIFVTPGLKRYLIGDLTHTDRELIENIYIEPKLMLRCLDEYIEAYKDYVSMPAFEDIKTAWYNKSSIIAHACGGFVNGKRVRYSNSEEALRYSIEHNFRLIECDIMSLESGEVILAHEYERYFYGSAEEHYTVMNPEILLSYIKDNPLVTCIIDIKWKDHDDYEICVREIDRIIGELTEESEEYKQLKEQIVLEVYNEPTVCIAKEHGYDIAYSTYRNIEMDYFDIIRLCMKYNISTVIMNAYGYNSYNKMMKIFRNKNIKMFVFTTNSVEDYIAFRKYGVTGIFTDYLTEEDVSCVDI